MYMACSAVPSHATSPRNYQIPTYPPTVQFLFLRQPIGIARTYPVQPPVSRNTFFPSLSLPTYLPTHLPRCLPP